MRLPSLLLHVCCGPCATHVFDLLKSSYHLVAFFYNPNIHPLGEFLARLEATARLCKQHEIGLWVPPHGPETWMEETRGRESDPEGGERCNICFRLRLDTTARMARMASLEGFATTLTISPHKNSKKINGIGNEIARRHGIAFLPADFKKKHGYQESVRKSRELDLYRQRYCGCCHSRRPAGPGEGGGGPVSPPGARPA